MPTRRRFLAQTAGIGLASAAGLGRGSKVRAATESSVSRIRSVERRDDTILRLGGNGDDFLMTWASDDRQLVAVQDGAGWYTPPKGEYNSRLWAMDGGPQGATFHEISSYPELMNVWHSENISRYYGFGTLALDGRIYQFLSTPAGPPGSSDMGWIGAKLIYSPDQGRTWCNQDGSTPVVWEPWPERSRRNIVFFKEPQNAFSLPAILQMGRNYEANRDGYVYVYSPNGLTDGTMNQLVMFRVPKHQILDREAYEYFAGLGSDGSAKWSGSIEARAVVHTFPRGWVNTGTFIVESWFPSVVYNVPLDLYMMANWGVGCGADGSPFGKPSYLGFWVATHPWGPWMQIYEETAWRPNHDAAARCYAPQIAPKWIAADGRSFWLVWTDFQQKTSAECLLWAKEQEDLLNPKETRKIDRDEAIRYMAQARRCQPYYAFNTQRVDLFV